jgi:hypothetical protein
LEEAIKWLEKAIARHERHMNGTERTSESSQMKMMDEMKRALREMKNTSGIRPALEEITGSY